MIITAPSGAGKTTIVRHLLNKEPRLEFSVSATTRQPRSNEMDGREYYFIPVPEFKKRVKNNEFVEWEEVYKNYYYGTLKKEVDRIWAKGNHILFDVDVKGGINLKKIYGHQAISVFIMPPSIRELEKRLRLRGTDDPEGIKTRIAKAREEMRLADQFDFIVINNRLELAESEVLELVNDFINR